MLAELPPERLNAVAPEPKSLADIVADFAAAFDDLFAPEERTPDEEARIAAIRARMAGERPKREAAARRDAQRREMAEMFAAREDAPAYEEEPPEFPEPPVAILGPGLHPVWLEPGEVLGVIALATQARRAEELARKLRNDQRRTLKAQLTKRANARAA